jgi:hypothetical protein
VLLYGSSEHVLLWVADRIDPMPVFGPDAVAIGVMREGRLIAGVVYDRYTGTDMQLSIAADSPRWATRENIASLLSYPYKQLGCARTTLIQSVNNDRARKLAVGLGYEIEGLLRCGWDGHTDALVLGALFEDVAHWF